MKDLRSLAIAAFGVGAARALAFVTGIISARMLAHDDFGKFSYLYISILTFSTFALMGQSQLVNYVVSGLKTDEASAFAHLNFILKATVMLACAAVAIVLPVFFWGGFLHLGWGDVGLALLAGCLIFLIVMNGLVDGMLYGLTRSHLMHVHMLWCFPLTLLFLLAGAKYLGVSGIFLALVLSRLLFIMVGQRVVGSDFIGKVLHPTVKLQNPKQFIWEKMLPVFASSILVAPVIWVAVSYVAKSVGQVEFGRFNVAYQLYLAMIFFPAALSPFFMSRLLAIVDYSGFRKSLVSTILGNFAVALLMALAVYVLKDWVLGFFGKQFAVHSAGYLDYMLVAAVLYALNVGFSHVFSWHGRFWAGAAVNMVWAGCFLTLVFLLAKTSGAYALCFGFIGAYALMSVIQMLLARRYEVSVAPS